MRCTLRLKSFCTVWIARYCTYLNTATSNIWGTAYKSMVPEQQRQTAVMVVMWALFLRAKKSRARKHHCTLKWFVRSELHLSDLRLVGRGSMGCNLRPQYSSVARVL